MLSTHLLKANSLLRTKQYDQSLKGYQLCLNFSSQQPFSLQSISFSLLGYNHFCLLNYQQAQQFYTKALQLSPFDSTTLFRRATLYLKIKQYQKAAIDIRRLVEIEPEAMRVGVMVMEIKQKLGTDWKENNKGDPFKIESNKKQENDEEQDIDEEQALNFSNLKKIDRVSLREIKVAGKRNSQINFGEDERIEYEQSESEQFEQQKYGKQEDFSKDKEQFQQLQLNSIQQSEQPSAFKFVVSKNMKNPKKSILKCSIAYRIPQNSEIDTIKTAPMNASRVKDIDGKKLESSKFIRFSAHIGKSQILQPNYNSKPRKSCMKNISMIVNPNSIIGGEKYQPRSTSRLSFGELKNMEGKIIYQKKNSYKVDSSGDESDEYNIFGNKGEKQLNEELLKIKSFVGSNDDKQFPPLESKVMKPKKSILKPKNVSIIEKDKSQIQFQLQSSINKKKSVIFK